MTLVNAKPLSEFPVESADKVRGWYLIGSVFVDSGQMMIGDPCYLHHWVDDKPNFQDKDKTGVYSYGGACNVTCSLYNAGVLNFEKPTHMVGASVVCSTGYGDGVYPVYVYYGDEGRPSKMMIDFMGENINDYPRVYEDDDEF